MLPLRANNSNEKNDGSIYTIHLIQVVLALAVKYLFYEDWEENCRMRKNYLEVGVLPAIMSYS